MKVSEVMKLLSCECLAGEELIGEYKVDYGFGSDLMSDVLAFSSHNTLLLTGLCSPQVIRTAEMLDISVIVFVRGKMPNELTIEMAKKNNIVLLRTKKILFSSCGLLYDKGLRGVEIFDRK